MCRVGTMNLLPPRDHLSASNELKRYFICSLRGPKQCEQNLQVKGLGSTAVICCADSVLGAQGFRRKELGGMHFVHVAGQALIDSLCSLPFCEPSQQQAPLPFQLQMTM